jgi:hypothetical protein
MTISLLTAKRNINDSIMTLSEKLESLVINNPSSKDIPNIKSMIDTLTIYYGQLEVMDRPYAGRVKTTNNQIVFHEIELSQNYDELNTQVDLFFDKLSSFTNQEQNYRFKWQSLFKRYSDFQILSNLKQKITLTPAELESCEDEVIKFKLLKYKIQCAFAGNIQSLSKIRAKSKMNPNNKELSNLLAQYQTILTLIDNRTKPMLDSDDHSKLTVDELYQKTINLMEKPDFQNNTIVMKSLDSVLTALDGMDIQVANFSSGYIDDLKNLQQLAAKHDGYLVTPMVQDLDPLISANDGFCFGIDMQFMSDHLNNANNIFNIEDPSIPYPHDLESMKAKARINPEVLNPIQINSRMADSHALQKKILQNPNSAAMEKVIRENNVEKRHIGKPRDLRNLNNFANQVCNYLTMPFQPEINFKQHPAFIFAQLAQYATTRRAPVNETNKVCGLIIHLDDGRSSSGHALTAVYRQLDKGKVVIEFLDPTTGWFRFNSVKGFNGFLQEYIPTNYKDHYVNYSCDIYHPVHKPSVELSKSTTNQTKPIRNTNIKI